MPPGTGVVAGRVTDGRSLLPVPGAIVTLATVNFGSIRAISDGDGRFVFHHLPPGEITLKASKGGYMEGAYGRTRPSGPSQPIPLGVAGRVTDANLSVWKYAAITGTVLDEDAEPLVSRVVRVMRRTIDGGESRLVNGPADATDDRGIYRIATLEPGDYIVCVPQPATLRVAVPDQLRDLQTKIEAADGAPGNAVFTMAAPAPADSGPGSIGFATDGSPADDLRSYPTTCLPAGSDPRTMIRLVAGEERTGIDFRMRPATPSHVSGLIDAPPDEAAGVTIRLIPLSPTGEMSTTGVLTTQSDARGAFTFTGVMPSAYILTAVRSTSDEGLTGGTYTEASSPTTLGFTMTFRAPRTDAALPQMRWAAVPLTVAERDVSGLVLSLRTGLKVSGTIAWVGSMPVPTQTALGSVRLSLEPADARTAAITGTLPGRFDDASSFSTTGVPPGRYILRIAGPVLWSLRSAITGGRDIADIPLEVSDRDVTDVVLTLTTGEALIEGTAVDLFGATDSTAGIVVFPEDPQLRTAAGSNPRRLRYVRAGASGDFRIEHLPAGRYNLAAIHDSVAANWRDPAFLESIAPGATTVELDEGQTLTQVLKVAP